MPIEFRPAQPFSPNISEQYGETDQFTRLAPLLEQHQQAVYQAQAQQRHDAMSFASAQADRSQQGSQAAAQLDFQRQSQQAQMGQQAAQADAQRLQQQAQHEQQINAQLELQRNEFTYKDQLELQRYKNGMSEIENSPNLTPEERQDMRVQFATKIDPMERKLAQSRMQQQAAQTQQLHQHMAEQDIIAKDRAAFMAGNLQAVTRDVTDAGGNVLGSMMMIPGEKPHWIDKKPDQSQEKAAAYAQAQEFKHNDRMDLYNHKKGEAFAQIDKDVTHEVNAEEKTHANPGSVDWDGRKNTLIQRRQEAYLKGNPPPKPPAGAGGRSPEADFGVESKPFKYTDPTTQSATQRAVVKDLSDRFEQVRTSTLPPELKDKAAAAYQEAGRLLGQFGSVQAMEAKDPAKYAQLRDHINQIDAALTASKKGSPASNPKGGVALTGNPYAIAASVIGMAGKEAGKFASKKSTDAAAEVLKNLPPSVVDTLRVLLTSSAESWLK